MRAVPLPPGYFSSWSRAGQWRLTGDENIYKPGLQLGLSPAVRSLEQRDHHLALGEKERAHGCSAHCLLRISCCVPTVEMFERHLTDWLCWLTVVTQITDKTDSQCSPCIQWTSSHDTTNAQWREQLSSSRYFIIKLSTLIWRINYIPPYQMLFLKNVNQ